MKMVLFLVAVAIGALIPSRGVLAAKPVDTCKYVVDGTIPYPDGYFSGVTNYTTGYDIFGYNYQARIFNGTFANAYLGRKDYGGLPPYTGDAETYLEDHAVVGTADYKWLWDFRDVRLQMKWNDAWLANKDCAPQDNVLDRHVGFDTYRGSGAWLTNHATGTYTGSKWELNGSYVLSFDYLGSPYVHDMVVTTASEGTFSGTGGYPSGSGYSTTWTVDGTVTGNTVAFHILYDGSSYYVDAVGTIDGDGTLSGTWLNGSQSGAWTATTGVAAHPECTVSDFVKIVAVPSDAILKDGFWYTAGDAEIGKEIWGSFAIIQEEGSDPCREYGVIDYMSPFKKGLGNW